MKRISKIQKVNHNKGKRRATHHMLHHPAQLEHIATGLFGPCAQQTRRRLGRAAFECANRISVRRLCRFDYAQQQVARRLGVEKLGPGTQGAQGEVAHVVGNVAARRQRQQHQLDKLGLLRQRHHNRRQLIPPRHNPTKANTLSNSTKHKQKTIILLLINNVPNEVFAPMVAIGRELIRSDLTTEQSKVRRRFVNEQQRSQLTKRLQSPLQDEYDVKHTNFESKKKIK